MVAKPCCHGYPPLDAVHLPAAQRAGTSLRTVVTYDDRMVDAAAVLGMPTVSPTSGIPAGLDHAARRVAAAQPV